MLEQITPQENSIISSQILANQAQNLIVETQKPKEDYYRLFKKVEETRDPFLMSVYLLLDKKCKKSKKFKYKVRLDDPTEELQMGQVVMTPGLLSKKIKGLTELQAKYCLKQLMAMGIIFKVKGVRNKGSLYQFVGLWDDTQPKKKVEFRSKDRSKENQCTSDLQDNLGRSQGRTTIPSLQEGKTIHTEIKDSVSASLGKGLPNTKQKESSISKFQLEINKELLEKMNPLSFYSKQEIFQRLNQEDLSKNFAYHCPLEKILKNDTKGLYALLGEAWLAFIFSRQWYKKELGKVQNIDAVMVSALKQGWDVEAYFAFLEFNNSEDLRVIEEEKQRQLEEIKNKKLKKEAIQKKAKDKLRSDLVERERKFIKDNFEELYKMHLESENYHRPFDNLFQIVIAPEHPRYEYEVVKV